MQMLDKANPRLAIVEYPCTVWSTLNSNINYQGREEELARLREEDRPFLKLTEDIFASQVSRGGHAVSENPATAASQSQPEILRLRERWYETTSCLCMFGLRGKRGMPMMKRVRFIATHEYFIQELDLQCDHSHQHELVEGSNTCASQCYPPALGDAICRAYWRVVELEDFGTVTYEDYKVKNASTAWFVDVNKQEDKWRPLLQEAEEILARKVQSSIFVTPESDLYRKICELVPWQVMNIQLAHLPKAKRVRPGLEECHRASVLLQNDNSIIIETEYLKTAQAPRERFITPVRVGIFILGYAPGEPQAPSPQKEGERQYVEAEPGEAVGERIEGDHFDDKSLVKQSYGGETWFEGPPLTNRQKKLAPSIVKLHKNLGHPSQPDFTRALVQEGNVETEAIELSRRLKCAVCERSRRPKAPRPTSFKIVGSFNSKLCMDFVYVPDAEGNNYQFLHILEPNGSFNVFYPSATRNPGDVWGLFCLLWASWAGFPQTLWCDKDGAFEGEFLERIRSMGTLVDNPPAEAHWQAGQVEAYNRAFKDTAQKLVDEMVLRGDRDMRTLGCAVAAAMNDRIRSSGCSAYQWLFGKSPQIPEDVLSPDGKFEALQAMELDEELRRRNRIRAMADEKISAYRLNEAVRTAILRKSHPMKDDYEPGELVAFWREAKYRQGKKGQKGKRIPASWYRGVVVGPRKGDGATKQNNFWVTSNGRCILVAKEQMRPAFGTELWPVHEHVLQELQDNPPQQYLDLRTDELPPVPEDDDEDLDQVPLFPDKKEEERMEEELGEGPPGEASSPAADAMDILAEQEAAEAEDPTATASDMTTLPTHPSTRAPGTPVGQLWPQTPQKKMRTTPSHSAPSEAAPSAVTDLAMEQNPAVPEPSSAMVTNVGKDFWHADHKRGILVRHHLQPRRALYDPGRAQDLPVRLDKLSRLRTTVMFLDSGRKMVRDTWVSPNSNTPMDKKWTGKTIFKILVRSAMEAHAEWQNPERMSRKDRKALEKELPWSAIPDEQKELYRQALVKEWNTWLKYEAVLILNPECSRQVELMVDASRILAARVCYRDKHAATPWLEIKPKARIVCRGDNDPDLLELRRDAPTLTRLGLMLILQLAASGEGWIMVTADITGAFLQGDQSLAKRKEPLFIRQPKEGLPGLQPGQLLLVVRGIFGLANSPRLFWRFLRDSLITLGFVQSTLDKALFMYYEDHQLILALGAHVDDLICAGCPKRADNILNKVKTTFDFGDWHDSRQENKMVYGGKEIIVRNDGSVTLGQESFIRALTLTPVPKWRRIMKDSTLTATEVTEMKSGGGCLHWLIAQTRPDLAAGTSLAMSGSPTVTNLLEVNKLLQEAIRSQDWKLKFVPIPLEQARIIAFSDASWANTEELKSQAGYLVFVTGPEVFTPTGDAASLVEWKSHKIRRRCRSTLAAETMSLDAATDAALFTRELLAEICIEGYQPTHSGRLDETIFPTSMATHCRSLFDLLIKDGPLSSTQEKRLTLDIGALREVAEELEPTGEMMKEIYRWVPTNVQRADHLTKLKPAAELREILDRNWISMVADEETTSTSSPTRSALWAAAAWVSRASLLGLLKYRGMQSRHES